MPSSVTRVTRAPRLVSSVSTYFLIHTISHNLINCARQSLSYYISPANRQTLARPEHHAFDTLARKLISSFSIHPWARGCSTRVSFTRARWQWYRRPPKGPPET